MAGGLWRFRWIQRQPHYGLAAGVFCVLGPLVGLVVFLGGVHWVLFPVPASWPLALQWSLNLQLWAIALVIAYMLGVVPALIAAMVTETVRITGLRPVWLAIIAAAAGAAVSAAWHSPQMAAASRFSLPMAVTGAVAAFICTIVLLLTIRWTDG